jgi:hypothetical protein
MKEMLAELREQSKSANSKIDEHIAYCASRDVKVDQIQEDVQQAKGSIKTLKWVVGLVIAIIGIAAKLLV